MVIIFDIQNRGLYNLQYPQYFSKMKFADYWFETGTPFIPCLSDEEFELPIR